MAKSLKTLGISELNTLRARVRRQHVLGRIYHNDAVYIEGLLDLVEGRIISMYEIDIDGNEVGWGDG